MDPIRIHIRYKRNMILGIDGTQEKVSSLGMVHRVPEGISSYCVHKTLFLIRLFNSNRYRDLQRIWFPLKVF